MTTPPPDWAIQVPSAPVQQPPGKAYQIMQQSTQQVQALQQQLLQSIWQGFLQIVDGFLNLSMTPSEQLAAWAQDVAAAGTFLTTLLEGLGIPDQTATGLVTWLENVGDAAGQAFGLLEDFFATGNWSDLTAAWTDLVQAIFGSSTQLGLLGLIPAPAVVDVTQNLQPVWDFPDAASVSAGAQWSWDGTIDHTGVSGSGSAKVVANGVLQALKGTPGSVQPGQTVAPTAFVTWSGLSAAAGTHPIQLQLTPYSTSGSELVAGSSFEVAQITSPGASSSSYSGAVLVDGLWWVELTGSYTVPSSGVTAVQSRPVVTADATAGTINWDDCAVNVTGGFLSILQDDLASLSGDFTANNTAFATFLQNALATIEAGGSFSTIITALEAEWTTYTTTVSGLLSSEIFTIQQLLNSLLGIDTGTGLLPQTQVNGLTAIWNGIFGTTSPTGASQIEQSAINGLATSLSALLGTTTFQSLLDGVANALGHSGTGHSITDIETYLGIIPPTNVTNVLGGSSLGADVQAILDYIANALGHTGTGHTLTQIETYLGLIPAGNVTSTLGLSTLAADLSSLLGTTTFQSLLDAVANVLGHSGTGHTIANIETYLGIIPPANVTNVLGGANLGADVSTVHSTVGTQGGWLGRLLTDVTILFDVFHTTYTSTQWTNAWTDLMALVGLTNSTTAPSNPTPTIGTAINNNTSTLNTTNTNLFGSTTPGTTVQAVALPTSVQSANTYWSTLMTNLFGASTPATAIQTAAVPSGITATKISNVLGGANLGADVSAVSTTATNGTSWATRLTNDLAILLDVFHLTYTSTQWNSAWSDLMSLLGVVNSTSTPTNPTPTIGSSITTAQSTASSASSAASTAQAGAQATADGIHQAINNDTSTGTSLTASAVKGNLQSIPHVNVQQGVFARVSRLTTSNGSAWSAGQIPTSTYDTVVTSNSNITFSNGRSFQVALEGTYYFNFSFVALLSTSPDTVAPQFYVNGSLARTYPYIWIPSFTSSGLFGYGAVIELGVNDTITPGFNHASTWTVTNDTTGSGQNSMEIALLTRN